MRFITNYYLLESKLKKSKSMAQIIDGKAIAAQIRAEIRQDVEDFIAKGNRKPHLTAIIVGEDQASETYVRMKMNAAKDIGISSETKRLPANITEQELLEVIDQLNNDPNVDGILVQLPVPEHMNERKICNAVVCEKDVDGFNVFNVGRMCLDMKSMIPATPLGVIELLRRTNIDTFGKNAVVVGRSKNVSMPIAMLMHADGRNETNAMDATVTICHRFTPPKELAKYCSMADIIITATGVPGLITKEMVKPGACVIDVGITRITDSNGKTKLVGDVDYDEVRQVAGYITPVPGGVGPMTVAMLMLNTVTAAKNLAAASK
ncbi:mitochondrial, Bifunctional methylenetetrahydrofolate dehydrogenase/cyclohydrolase [Lucilia cuprina]|nr:mitochondrial, Bifunctional methylenetetrahydrofolate dehydrogenase/cyclohydrolase [Lucilia cuprina]